MTMDLAGMELAEPISKLRVTQVAMKMKKVNMNIPKLVKGTIDKL